MPPDSWWGYRSSKPVDLSKTYSTDFVDSAI